MVHYLPAPCCSWFHRLSYSLPGCPFLRLEILKGIQIPATPLWSFSNFTPEVEVGRANSGTAARYGYRIDLCVSCLKQFCGCFFLFFLNILSILFTLLTNLVFVDLFILAPKSLSWQWGNRVRAQYNVCKTVGLYFLNVHCLLFTYSESHLHFITPSLCMMKVCCFLHRWSFIFSKMNLLILSANLLQASPLFLDLLCAC